MFNFLKKNKKPQPPDGFENIAVKKMEFKDGRMDMVTQHPVFVELINNIVEFFFDAGGENYVTIGGWHPKVGLIDINVQKVNGKTAAQDLANMKAALKPFAEAFKPQAKQFYNCPDDFDKTEWLERMDANTAIPQMTMGDFRGAYEALQIKLCS